MQMGRQRGLPYKNQPQRYVAVRQSAPTSGLLALWAGVAHVGALYKIKPDTGIVVIVREGKRWAGDVIARLWRIIYIETISKIF